MHPTLKKDWEEQAKLLASAQQAALSFLDTLDERPPAVFPPAIPPKGLPEEGLGTSAALRDFFSRYESTMNGSPGPRYFGFVTGGATPAGLVGDWLASTYDQNPTSDSDSSAPQVEAETIGMLRDLFGLPESFHGAFVSGATIANMAGLAQGRQWVGRQHGVDVASAGLHAIPPIHVLGATLHSSTYKSLAMIGLGKQSVVDVARLPDREAIDVDDLARKLAELDEPCIVVASGGTVNTVDFDNLAAIASLREKYPFWLHVDAAFGGFAAASPRFAHLLDGLELADSITIDAHKWLNVPYDSAMMFTRHPQLQLETFQNAAAYLGDITSNPSLVHLTPQNSRRFRALAAWMSLRAYGRDGYQELVERNVDFAHALGDWIEASAHFRLLAPVRLNCVCFTLTSAEIDVPSSAQINQFLHDLQADGRVFMTPTVYDGTPGIRAAISNWQTQDKDLAITTDALEAVALAQTQAIAAVQ